MRGGIELDGVLHLRDFIKAGGVFITLSSSSALPIHFGLAQGLSVRDTPNLWARGGVYRADVGDKTSPLVYGYDDSLGVYFSQSPVFAMGGMGGRAMGMMPGMGTPPGRVSGRGSINDPDIPQGRARDLGQKTVEEFRKAQKDAPPQPVEEGPRMGMAPMVRPRIVLNFARNAADLLISGGLAAGEELAGSPALADVTLGQGHVVLFSFNPTWRSQTHGSYFLIFNALLNWKNLDAKPK
jgi:hypothetical protein